MNRNRLAGVLESLSDALTKCGGPGGTPGPCPSGRGQGGSGKEPPAPIVKPNQSRPTGKKPPAPKVKPAPGQKPKPASRSPKRRGKSGWSKIAKAGFKLFGKAQKRVGKLLKSVKKSVVKKLGKSKSGKEILEMVNEFSKMTKVIGNGVNKVRATVGGLMSQLGAAIQPKAAAVKADPEALMDAEMRKLKVYLGQMSKIEAGLMKIAKRVGIDPESDNQESDNQESDNQESDNQESEEADDE